MRVPSFRKITVEQYQELSPVYEKLSGETDPEKIINGWVNVIAILTNKQVEEIESLSIDDLKSQIKKLSWLSTPQTGFVRKYLFLKGKLYKATLDAKNLSPAQYVEIKTFLKRGGVTSELHNLLASIYSPLTLKGFVHDGKGHEKHANNFKKAKLSKVSPTVFFYSRVLKKSIENIQVYGIKIAEKQMKEAEKLLMETLRETLEDIGVGTQ